MHNCNDKSYVSLQFKYMDFHIFTCILQNLREFYKLTMWPAPCWLDSLAARPMPQYCTGQGFKFCLGDEQSSVEVVCARFTVYRTGQRDCSTYTHVVYMQYLWALHGHHKYGECNYTCVIFTNLVVTCIWPLFHQYAGGRNLCYSFI